jgi:hypothetical protein
MTTQGLGNSEDNGATVIYKNHDSDTLRKLYKEKPYQGQHPDLAKVLIVGQDANYPVMGDALLKTIKEYHEDGVAFWEKHDVHHPFLLPDFSSEVGGIRYHKQFRKLALDKRCAKYISFVELLDEATYGNTGKGKLKDFTDKVSHGHIAKLETWMINSGDKLIFIPKMVMSTYLGKVFSKTRMLSWLIKCDKPMALDEPVLLWSQEGVSIYKYNHFSGAVSDRHINSMSAIIKRFLANYACHENSSFQIEAHPYIKE